MPRTQGLESRRKAKRNLPHDFYNVPWLRDAIAKGYSVAKEGRGARREKWMDYSVWERNLSWCLYIAYVFLPD